MKPNGEEEEKEEEDEEEDEDEEDAEEEEERTPLAPPYKEKEATYLVTGATG